MWNIDFKTYREGQLIQEGFETSYAHDISHALQDADTVLDLDGIDSIEIKINNFKLSTEPIDQNPEQ